MKIFYILSLLCLTAIIFSASSCTNNDNPLATPMDATLSASLRTEAKACFADYKLPGGMVVGIWSDTKGNFIWSQGYSDTASQTLMNESMKFRIGQISQSFVASIVLEMVGEKLLSLDDRMSKFYEEKDFPGSSDITVRELLSHTSGLQDMRTDADFRSLYSTLIPYNNSFVFPPYEPDSLLIYYGGHIPKAVKGKYLQANTNYFILGRITEMLSTYYIEGQMSRRIQDYVSLPSVEFPLKTWQTTAPFANGYIGVGNTIRDTTRANSRLYWASEWIASDVYDLNRWLRCVMQGLLFEDKAYLRNSMLTPVDNGYGLGIFCGSKIGSSGTVPGYSASAYYLPDIKASVVVLINSSVDNQNIADSVSLRLRKILGSGVE